MKNDGVIVASDIFTEWLIPWWWDNYRRTNSFAVIFVDLGMSQSMRKWCKKRGECISLASEISVSSKELIDPAIAKEWEKGGGEKFWETRAIWFKKPLICLQSPFRRTIWSDLDCEILGPLDPLFAYCDNNVGLSLVQYDDLPTYNSGIIVFKKEVPLLKTWVQKTFSSNHLFRGDEELLSHLIVEQKLPIIELPRIYNWNYRWPNHDCAKVIHWYGAPGKTIIYNKINSKE